jgi:hypothetical protein
MMRKLRRPARPAVKSVVVPDVPAPSAMRLMEKLQTSYLQTPARIIAEDETDIVLSLRISRAWLRENHHLLAALSDAAAC